MHPLVRSAAILSDESHLNPANTAEEKKKFFDDHSYEPRFTYRELDADTDALRKGLERTLQQPQDDDGRLSQLMQGRARELMRWLDLLLARGSEEFTQRSIELFGTPDKSLLAEAERLVESAQPREEEERTISAEEAKERLQEALDELGPGWRAVIDEQLIAEAHVNPQLQLLRVRAGTTFTPAALRQLIVHEVGVHARRSTNASRQPNPIFTAGTAGYLETEEGLALFHEEEEGCLDGGRQRQVAARVIAVAHAQRHGFAETYRKARSILNDDEDAFKLTVRVKRGLGDTSKPGGLTKDLLYLKGYLRVKELSPEDRKLLYTGKVSYHHLPLIKELVRERKAIIP
ncbi:DUF1704 domain-containing protein [Candidatus Woesearchaeota archaeon]|nr:DUF1704 domain-containing protein [Candidatus Woesearchaeota archaeon]